MHDKQDRHVSSNADEVLNAVWMDFERIVQHLDAPAIPTQNAEARELRATDSIYPVALRLAHVEPEEQSEPKSPDEGEFLPLYSNDLNIESKFAGTDGLAIIILALICANIRNCTRPATIVRALDMLLYLSRHLTDETKLDWLLPYIIITLSNDAPSVRIAALRTLTEALRLTEFITPANSTIFTQYILPNVSVLKDDADEVVRCAYAQSLATLAETGQRFLDMTQAMKADGTLKLSRTQEFDSPYEVSRVTSLPNLRKLNRKPDELRRESA